MYRVAGYSYIGLRKKTNQDSCCAEVAMTPYGDTALFAVCDGVGGLSAGEMASCSVIRWLERWFETSYPSLMESLHENVDALFDHVQLDWETGLLQLNAALRTYGRTTGNSLGTTFTAILFFQGRYVIGHVGDCRVYRFFNGSEMEILTDDQTWVAREVARGNISPEQARSHPKKNVILQSVGTQTELQPVFTRGDSFACDLYMVCCDGFRNELFDDELIGAFGGLGTASEKELYAACEALADLAMSRNEADNITAVAATFQPGTDYAFSHQNPASVTSVMNPITVRVEEITPEEVEVTTSLEPLTEETIARARAEAQAASAHSDLDTFLDVTTVLGEDGE
ncbi:MAG: serine/threonine-protein phosphatase [Atopobiaceae bacterium]|nr:serine/threonine-protein phosphatase [Atopobiaceae bacterium]